MTGERSDENQQPRLADIRETESVYQAAEDSRLLADTLGAYVTDSELVLDVGTGSGYVGHRVQMECDATVIGIDINPEACQQAATAGLQAVRGNMVEPFRPDTFDTVCCNPPYLPTPPDHEWDDWMERALSGGPDGRAVVDPFLESVGRVLTDDGQALLLISTLTGPDAVRETARAAGLDSSIVAEESHPFEKLLVLRLTPDR